MRPNSLSLLLLAAAAATPAFAQQPNLTQEGHPLSLGLAYTYLRSNILPGCNCVSLEGGSAEAGLPFTPRLSALADFSIVHKGGITPDGYKLTQLTYTFGVRGFPLRSKARLRPFAELLFGGAHVSGTLAPMTTGVGPSNNSLALQAGGGVTYRLNRHFLLRANADYLLTTLSNDSADRQNDLKISAGVNYRFGRH